MVSGSVAGHAFLSYVRDDAPRVDRLERFLKDAGVPVWRDVRELWVGDNWKLRIREAIDQGALAFIACFSERSAARETSYQYEELLLAAEQYRQRPPDKPWLLPVRFADCKVPHLDLGAGRTLDVLHRVDLFGDDAAWATGLAHLLQSLQRVIPDLAPRVKVEPPTETAQPYPTAGRPASASTRAAPPASVLRQPLSVLQPSNLHTPSGQTTDIVMRCTVVFPRCHQIPGRSDDVVSLITGTRRENAIAALLDRSELSAWFARQADAYHLAGIPSWSPYGPHNAGDNSFLVLQPPDDRGNPGPLAGMCQVNTGWVVPQEGEPDELQPGLQLVTDLTVRVLEYDAARRPSQIRHATTPPPAPAAVTLTFVFESLVALLDTAQIARAAWSELLGGEPPDTGNLVCWFTTHGGPRLDQLIDLTDLKLIPGSGGGAYRMVRDDLPLEGDPQAVASSPARRVLVHRMLSGVLEHAGFRDFDRHLDPLAGPVV